MLASISFFFFFNDTATTEIYTLSLHDALPISSSGAASTSTGRGAWSTACAGPIDRKSTRLNSSHLVISYAVFCLKKKKNKRGNELTKPEVTRLGHRQDVNSMLAVM